MIRDTAQFLRHTAFEVAISVRNVGAEYNMIKKVGNIISISSMYCKLRANAFSDSTQETIARAAACAIKDENS